MLSLQMDRVPTRIARRSFARSHYAHLALSMLILAAAGGVALYRINVMNSRSARNDPGKFLRIKATLLERRAQSGDVSSQVELAGMLSDGLGVPRDESAAAHWNTEAARQGEPRAQFRLGRAYINGAGVQQDAAQGGDWVRKAAEQGVADAQLDYGLFLFFGLGGEADPVAGYRWIERAADSGSRSALSVLEKARGQMSAEQIKAAETSS